LLNYKQHYNHSTTIHHHDLCNLNFSASLLVSWWLYMTERIFNRCGGREGLVEKCNSGNTTSGVVVLNMSDFEQIWCWIKMLLWCFIMQRWTTKCELEWFDGGRLMYEVINNWEVVGWWRRQQKNVILIWRAGCQLKG
jgi:hypothetical protein